MPPAATVVVPSASANATILIYLSLFLLLVVFFIVLNTHSTPREYRVRAVLGSVERSFAPQTETGGTELAPTQGSAAAIALSGLKRLGDLFETDLAIAKVAPIGHGRLMVVSMAVDDLFEGGSAFVRPERVGLLDRISREIGEHDGVRFDMDFLIAVGSEPAGKGPIGDPVARAAALARALIIDRAPADAISVGIEPGPSGTVRFLFSVGFPGEPRGDVGGGARAPR